jgi:hypothetical protein
VRVTAALFLSALAARRLRLVRVARRASLAVLVQLVALCLSLVVRARPMVAAPFPLLVARSRPAAALPVLCVWPAAPVLLGMAARWRSLLVTALLVWAVRSRCAVALALPAAALRLLLPTVAPLAKAVAFRSRLASLRCPVVASRSHPVLRHQATAAPFR